MRNNIKTLQMFKNKIQIHKIERMENKVASTLRRFANHTGFKNIKDASQIARAYVAMHVRMVHPSIIYPFVGSDYELVQRRTHSPPLSAYQSDRDIDSDAFIYLMQNGYENRPLSEEEVERFPALQHFIETMLPRPVGEEAWKNYERKDHWKARAYFLGLNWKNTTSYNDMMRSIYGIDGSSNQVEIAACTDFISAMQKYQPYQEMRAEEIGHMLQALNVKLQLVEQDMTVVKEIENAQLVGDELTHGFLEEKEPIVFIASESVDNNNQNVWKDIQENEMVKSYLERAGLTAFFSPKKAIKQMILSSLHLPIKDVPGAENIIPVSQSVNKPLPPVPKEAWPMLVNAIESLNVQKHKLDPESPALKDMLDGGETNALSTIQTVLSLYNPDVELEDFDPRIQVKILKKHPQVDSSVVQSIIKM